MRRQAEQQTQRRWQERTKPKNRHKTNKKSTAGTHPTTRHVARQQEQQGISNRARNQQGMATSRTAKRRQRKRFNGDQMLQQHEQVINANQGVYATQNGRHNNSNRAVKSQADQGKANNVVRQQTQRNGRKTGVNEQNNAVR